MYRTLGKGYRLELVLTNKIQKIVLVSLCTPAYSFAAFFEQGSAGFIVNIENKSKGYK